MYNWKKTIHLISGIPGSGKSTLALKLMNGNRYQIVENDDYWYLNNNEVRSVLGLIGPYLHHASSEEPSNGYTYSYEGKMTHLAGQWCAAEAFRRLRMYDEIAVPNTFILRKHVLGYADEAISQQVKIKLHYPTTDWANDPEKCFTTNIHGVPLERIIQMKEQFQPMNQQQMDIYLGIDGTEYAK